jgi:hypothetical protein
MNVGIGTEAALFPEKEYIMEISFAVNSTQVLLLHIIEIKVQTLSYANVYSVGGKHTCTNILRESIYLSSDLHSYPGLVKRMRW